MTDRNSHPRSIFTDFSPPAVPTPTEQIDALQKGLGRAALWARSGNLHFEPLFNACLFDQRFDVQSESNRAVWLWNLICGSERIADLRDAIQNSLRHLVNERDADQICELAFWYGSSGDQSFVKGLYEFVERRPFADSPSTGMTVLLRLDGEEAFRFIAKLRGRQFTTSDWEWYDDQIIETAIQQIGEQVVNQILDHSSDLDIRRFGEKRPKHTTPVATAEEAGRDVVARMNSFSVNDAITAARSDGKAYWLNTWGKHTTEANLERLLNHLWAEDEPSVTAKLLRAFSLRPLPHFDSRLIELCQHSDDDVCHWAIKALGQNQHPDVRSFALEQLETGNLTHKIVNLFVKNFEPGDEPLLIEKLKLPSDRDERHWMLTDAIELLEQHDEADVRQLAQVIYFESHCEICRYDAASLLQQRQAAPEWLVDECRLDAKVECRSLFKV